METICFTKPDPPALIAVYNIPRIPQAQYSLMEQLAIVKMAATRLGLYDADDFITRFIQEQNESTPH